MPDTPFLGYPKIIHVDMDAFFASVEILDHPELRGKPVVVGGDPNSRAVVAAASYEARKFGIHSAMPCSRAKRLCPQAIFLRPRMERYKEVSVAINKIFQRYTDKVEPLSLDEAWLDVTQNKLGIPSATWVATHIKWDIEKNLGLTSSAGVSFNKFLAKLASDEDKPNGLYVITPDNAAEFLARIQLKRLPGVGRVMAEKLDQLGLKVGADLLQMEKADLFSRFGKYGGRLYELIRGEDHRPVQISRERKSVGIERTFSVDVNFGPTLHRALETLSRGLFDRLKKHKKRGRTLTVKVKFADFTQVTRSYSSPSPLTKSLILSKAKTKLDEVRRERNNQKVRLLGLSISGFETLNEATDTS